MVTFMFPSDVSTAPMAIGHAPTKSDMQRKVVKVVGIERIGANNEADRWTESQKKTSEHLLPIPATIGGLLPTLIPMAVLPEHVREDAHEGTSEEGQEWQDCIRVDLSCHDKESEETGDAEEDEQSFA